MKKIQVVFAVAAIMAAAVGVYAKEVTFSTVYYEDLPTQDGTCNAVISLPCTEGTMSPCTTAGGHNVWKIVDNGNCEQVFKDSI
jgi:hypothetical protein